jgi:hypothetical protein
VDEGNPSTTTAQSPRPQVSNKASSELLALIGCFSKLFQMNTESVALSECAVWTVLLTWETGSWIHNLPRTLEAHGMEVIDHAELEPKKELSKAWTDDLLMMYEEMQMSVPKTVDAGPNPALTREMYQDLFVRVLKETGQGVSLSMNQLAGLAKIPSIPV